MFERTCGPVNTFMTSESLLALYKMLTHPQHACTVLAPWAPARLPTTHTHAFVKPLLCQSFHRFQRAPCKGFCPGVNARQIKCAGAVLSISRLLTWQGEQGRLR